MNARLRSSFTLAVLVAALLTTLVAPAVDARGPRVRRYHVGGPITLDTNLRSTSGVSVWAIDEYLRAATPLPPLGAAFLAAERKYKVNARFLLAAALHESAWGTSSISRVKHNLFGYNAFDRDPGRYATAYATYAANIDATAKFIKDFYLTPGGRWWGGQPTLRSMQRCWSSSHKWGVGVSRIATSIHLDSIARRSITFAAPVVSGPLHPGDRASVRLAWRGGAVPKGIEFVAHWEPIELDSEVAGATVASPVTGAPVLAGAADTAAAAALAASAGPSMVTTTRHAQVPARPTSVTARRARTGSRVITLSVAGPREPGTYVLDVEMLDAGRRPLPAADRLDIPGVEVHIWADRAVGYDLQPGHDGTGAVVRITNTGRVTIPSAPDQAAPGSRDPEAETARSLVTVTASSGDPAEPQSVVLLAAPLAADLLPGASASFGVTGIVAATGRTTSWLSVNVSVLGDATWLAASSTAGAWFSGAEPPASPATASPATASAATASPATTASPTATRAPAPAPTATPTPTATATTRPTPKASPAPSPTPAPMATPTPAPKATSKSTASPSPRPAKAATRAPAHVTKRYSEHSGAIAYRGGWASARGAYDGGAVAWSKTPGAAATFTFRGSSVRWIGPKGPTRGLALVILDGRTVARVNLWRPTFVARSVLFKRSFRTTGRHTLTIRVLSTPGHPYVAIDGFVVRS